jgi:type II secretory ATPase GspE/PulE/Tfp pilus assembly ATPase PilB-like protein
MSDAAVEFAPAEFAAEEIEGMEVGAAVDVLLRRAVQLRASDMFLLAQEGFMRIAVRRLGTVEPIVNVSQAKGRHLVNSIKARAGMEVGDSLRPHDGRWISTLEDRTLDLRINEIPTLYGSDLTIRLLDRQSQLLQLENLGMVHHQLADLKAMLQSPSGLILVTGPTGAGKTTTLYSCLHALNDGTRKINTIEDPIEYSIRGVCQSQVAPRIDLGFAELLRNILRQSPDVVMIGEVRDEPTAEIAVRAANSGHVVLATLHAPVASMAVHSMLAYGRHPTMLANSLIGVVAQRLVRTLNPATRIRYDMGDARATFEDVVELLRDGEGQAIYGPDKADPDSQGGYVYRSGLFEVMTVDDEIREVIARGGTRHDVQAKALAKGMLDFRRAALVKVARGETSIDEMMRVLPVELLALDG